MGGCFSHAPWWELGPQPRHVPWLGIKSATFWFAGQRSIHWSTPARAFLFIFICQGTPFKNLEGWSGDTSSLFLTDSYCPCWGHTLTPVSRKSGRWWAAQQENAEEESYNSQKLGLYQRQHNRCLFTMEPSFHHLRSGLVVYLVSLVVSVQGNQWEGLAT